MFANMTYRRGFKDLKTFASAVVKGLFVDWPMLRAQIGAEKKTDFGNMDLAIQNNWSYQQAVRELVSCSQTCLLHMFMFANMEKPIQHSGKVQPFNRRLIIYGYVQNTITYGYGKYG